MEKEHLVVVGSEARRSKKTGTAWSGMKGSSALLMDQWQFGEDGFTKVGEFIFS